MTPPLNRRTALAMLLLPMLASHSIGHAGPLLDRLREKRGEPADKTGADQVAAKTLRNVPYGPQADQTLDAYLPSATPGNSPVPIILMVHGGAWKIGDKTMSRSIDAKLQRWLPRGFVFVSINYRMLPDAKPDVQLQDVARALAFVQDKASSWGGDPGRVILMGHSAGAHLVTLLDVTPFERYSPRPRPVLGTVSLDSAVMDVQEMMSKKHYRLYDEPFGTDPAYWRQMSPTQQMTPGCAPVLSVYSTRRDDATTQTQQFAAKARTLGVLVETLGQDLSHGDINGQLGLDSAYTRQVEAFMASLDPLVARHLN